MYLWTIVTPILMIGAVVATIHITKKKQLAETPAAMSEAVSIVTELYKNNNSDASIDDKYGRDSVLMRRVDAFGERLDKSKVEASGANVVLFEPTEVKLKKIKAH